MDTTPLVVGLDRTDPRPWAASSPTRSATGSPAGSWPPGSGCRAAARWRPTWGCPASVTAQAYEQLVAEGWLEGRHGSGTYVAPVVAARAPDPAATARSPPGRPLVRLDAGTPWIDPRYAAALAPGLARRLHRDSRRAATRTPAACPSSGPRWPTISPAPAGWSATRTRSS